MSESKQDHMRPIVPSIEQVSQLSRTHEVNVSADWMDVMGHMNVAHYTAMFSAAMKGFRTSIGLGNNKVQELRVGTFAIETHTRYLVESHIGDTLQVHTRLIGRAKSGKRFHAIHFAVNANNQLLSSTFEAIVAIVDLDQRRMTAPPEDVLARLDAVIAEHQSLAWAAPLCGVLSTR